MASNQLDVQQPALRRKIIGTALAAVLAVVLIAIVVVRSGGDKLLNENGDTLVLVGKTDSEMSAPTRGKLTDVGGCLGLAGEGTTAIIIWPHGTIVATPDPLRVKVDDQTYKLGETVEINGGFSDPLEPSSYFYDRVPDACRTAGVFLASGS